MFVIWPLPPPPAHYRLLTCITGVAPHLVSASALAHVHSSRKVLKISVSLSSLLCSEPFQASRILTIEPGGHCSLGPALALRSRYPAPTCLLDLPPNSRAFALAVPCARSAFPLDLADSFPSDTCLNVTFSERLPCPPFPDWHPSPRTLFLPPSPPCFIFSSSLSDLCCICLGGCLFIAYLPNWRLNSMR